MRKKIKKQAGFSLIELVLIIFIMGIIVFLMVPKFLDMYSNAKQAAEEGVVVSVRVGADLYFLESQLYKRDPPYPGSLDSASNGPASLSNPFFDVVLETPIVAEWSKKGKKYTGPTGTKYKYKPSDGSFE